MNANRYTRTIAGAVLGTAWWGWFFSPWGDLGAALVIGLLAPVVVTLLVAQPWLRVLATATLLSAIVGASAAMWGLYRAYSTGWEGLFFVVGIVPLVSFLIGLAARPGGRRDPEVQ